MLLKFYKIKNHKIYIRLCHLVKNPFFSSSPYSSFSFALGSGGGPMAYSLKNKWQRGEGVRGRGPLEVAGGVEGSRTWFGAIHPHPTPSSIHPIKKNQLWFDGRNTSKEMAGVENAYHAVLGGEGGTRKGKERFGAPNRRVSESRRGNCAGEGRV